MKIKNDTKGFTLLELLVVVLIIGILASIAIPQYKLSVLKSRYASLMEITKSLYDAEMRFYLANDTFTEDLNKLDIDLQNCIGRVCSYDWGKCYFFSGAGVTKVGCDDKTKLRNSYVMFLTKYASYKPSQAACYAYSEDKSDIYNRVCNSLGFKQWTTYELCFSPGNYSERCNIWL